VLLGVLIYRRARRAAMLPGSALVKKDTRPFVLYLRSFQDDGGIKLRARATNGRMLLERLVKIPFEEVVTDHLWVYGPVLAIGNPQVKRKSVPLGAARDFIDDSIWRQKATELMQAAAMIVAIVAGTEGLAWEIDTIAALGLTSKLVLLLPPVRAQELETRWRLLGNHASSDIVPPHVDFARVRALFFPAGRVARISGQKGNDWTYEAVLDEAALLIAKERSAVHGATLSPRQGAHAGPLRAGLGRIYAFLPGVAGSALVLPVLAFLYMVVDTADKAMRPYAPPGEARNSFIAEMLPVCQKANTRLSAEQISKYCDCFVNSLADSVTNGDLDKIESDRTAFQAREKSVVHMCSEKTLGHGPM
jgi:hypothetical protein